ncbi:MAG: acetylxylan esterase [Pirellulaceae bacterium]|nr:acetylxylan esterase [Pirellulaceae bacterium]
MRSLRVNWRILLGIVLTCSSENVMAQKDGFNDDEAAVLPYVLPDPLRMQNGNRVDSAERWRTERRSELLNLFAEHVYGYTPKTPTDLKVQFEVGNVDADALGGQAIRKEVTMTFQRGDRKLAVGILIYSPKSDKPSPVFLGLNFNGNHAVHSDPNITLNTHWMRANSKTGVVDHRSTESSRGVEASRWQVEKLIENNFALATIYYGDIDPDYGENDKGTKDSWQNGLHPLFYSEGQVKPGPTEWGSIGAWSWGLSRALDYLETDPAIDAKHVAVIGHSRLGKTSLWAGAQDERFALVISNDSGCGGAALNKRNFGETVKRINSSFPHWFSDAFTKYDDNEAAMPIDQHELIALVAPRPVYVASAAEDTWADPRGEFLAAYFADPVYRLLGVPGITLTSDAMPSVNEPVNKGRIGYHIRSGVHDVTAYDWDQYLAFAKQHFR